MSERRKRNPPSPSVTALINATQRHMAYRLEMFVLPALEEHYADPGERWDQLKRALRWWQSQL